MFKKSESGRNVVEMIAIIVLMALLIALGLWGFKKASLSAKVNTISKDMATAVTERRYQIAQGGTSKKHTLDTKVGSTEMVVENRPSERDFFITIQTDSADTCEEMKKFNIFQPKMIGAETKLDNKIAPTPDFSTIDCTQVSALEFYFDGASGDSAGSGTPDDPLKNKCDGVLHTCPAGKCCTESVDEKGCVVQTPRACSCELDAPGSSSSTCGDNKYTSQIITLADNTKCYLCSDCPEATCPEDQCCSPTTDEITGCKKQEKRECSCELDAPGYHESCTSGENYETGNSTTLNDGTVCYECEDCDPVSLSPEKCYNTGIDAHGCPTATERACSCTLDAPAGYSESSCVEGENYQTASTILRDGTTICYKCSPCHGNDPVPTSGCYDEVEVPGTHGCQNYMTYPSKSCPEGCTPATTLNGTCSADCPCASSTELICNVSNKCVCPDAKPNWNATDGKCEANEEPVTECMKLFKYKGSYRAGQGDVVKECCTDTNTITTPDNLKTNEKGYQKGSNTQEGCCPNDRVYTQINNRTKKEIKQCCASNKKGTGTSCCATDKTYYNGNDVKCCSNKNYIIGTAENKNQECCEPSESRICGTNTTCCPNSQVCTKTGICCEEGESADANGNCTGCPHLFERGVSNRNGQGKDKGECCGTKNLISTTANTLFYGYKGGTSTQYGCCEKGKTYTNRNQTYCCNGTVYDNGTKCCAGTVYDNNTKCCASGSVVSNNHCCPNGSTWSSTQNACVATVTLDTTCSPLPQSGIQGNSWNCIRMIFPTSITSGSWQIIGTNTKATLRGSYTAFNYTRNWWTACPGGSKSFDLENNTINLTSGTVSGFSKDSGCNNAGLGSYYTKSENKMVLEYIHGSPNGHSGSANVLSNSITVKYVQ